MWIFVALVAAGIGYWIWRPQAASAAGQLPMAPPPGVEATSFTAAVVGGHPVAAFLPATRDAMVAVLRANGWAIKDLMTPAVFSIGPQGPIGAANALVALQAAAQSGLNVFADADMALKLSGSGAAPPVLSSPVFIAVAMTVPLADPATDGEVAATTTQEAVQALDPTFPGSRFVLFARANETF